MQLCQSSIKWIIKGNLYSCWISSTKDIKYEGAVIIKDPDGYNAGEIPVGTDISPGVFIAGTRAFSADNNPWTDEDPDISNALVTKSEQVGVGELSFQDSIRVDGISETDKGTLTGKTAADYTHKLPMVVNGETYFLLVVAN